jgi:predicted nucleic acid-binding protein
MSSMSDADRQRQFFDSNVLLYSFDVAAGEKRTKARELLDEVWKSRQGCVSIQVLQEFFVIATTRLRHPMTSREAVEKVSRFADWTVHEPRSGDVLEAIGLHEALRISFWDAMIVQSARSLECSILWSEDLNDGQRYAGVLVRNPFLDSVME